MAKGSLFTEAQLENYEKIELEMIAHAKATKCISGINEFWAKKREEFCRLAFDRWVESGKA